MKNKLLANETAMTAVLASPPLVFSFRVRKANMSEYVEKLHRLAQQKDFHNVSDIIEFDDLYNSYSHDRLSDKNVLQEHIRGYSIKGDKVYSILPERGSGFICALANGEKLPIGLAIYPEYLETGSGPPIRTRFSSKEANWESYCRTVCFRRKEYKSEQSDEQSPGKGLKPQIISHINALRILNDASLLGILDSVFDPTGFWDSTNTDDIIKYYARLQGLRCQKEICAR